ncbi:MAG: outer membrane lipoprotein-sorting protein [Burkholderiales bacterium]|nr:outer membrane lipoprotein-sorting protein [Burkholderiales bacterium]HQU62918.1 outer membrane lipoprotein-sorting protein [Nitrosomonas sp.]
MRNLLALLLTGLALIIGPAAAQTPPVDEIVHRANKAAYYEGQDGRAQVEMTITDSQGRERNRRMTILRKDAASTDAIENGAYRSEQKFYVYFTRPADVNKMGFLVWKKLDTDDDRWLYLPALDLVKRIAASDKRTSFVGSDFYYEDVSGRDIDEDHHELIDTTDNYYVLKNTPRNPSSVEFAYFVMYIHKDTFIPVQVEYFDAQDNRYRIAKALAVDNIQGYPTVTKASMENLKTGSKTVMQYSSVEYDIGLPDDIFSERYLRNPPTDYLR